MRLQQLRTVRVRCRAANGQGVCNHVIADVTGPLRFLGTRSRRPEIPDGKVWLQCGLINCRTWNVFDGPTEASTRPDD